jgi:hypothetical protein
LCSAQGLFELKDFETGRVNFPEQGSRSVNQVEYVMHGMKLICNLHGFEQVKRSVDKNIGIEDHTWEHQVKHTEGYTGISAPPLGVGFKSVGVRNGRLARGRRSPAKKQQLFSLDDFRNGRITFPETNTVGRTEPTGHFTAHNGDSPEWPLATAGMKAPRSSPRLRSRPAGAAGL